MAVTIRSSDGMSKPPKPTSSSTFRNILLHRQPAAVFHWALPNGAVGV